VRLSAAEILIQKKRCPQCEGHIPTARHSPLRFTLDNCKGSDYPLITLKGSSYRSEKRPTRFSSIRSQDPEPGQIICQQDLYPGNYAEGNGLFLLPSAANGFQQEHSSVGGTIMKQLASTPPAFPVATQLDITINSATAGSVRYPWRSSRPWLGRCDRLFGAKRRRPFGGHPPEELPRAEAPGALYRHRHLLQ